MTRPADDAEGPAEDAEILAERAFLATARAALRRMREEVVATGTPLSDAEDTDEIWHNTMYRLARARRAHELRDLPDVPLFFGRLDHPPGAVLEQITAAEADRMYVGRRHVRDDQGQPLVVDWRAPISAAFYQATPADPMGVRLRRRYGFDDAAELTAYEDELLTGPGAETGDSALLVAEIERPRSGPMRDIVATIQPEQDDLVRAPLHPTLCVQGAPGTGKTAVGLHRLAYLLYTEGERLTRGGGVAVVGPNRSFLSYIRRVLPALGEFGVAQTTVEELIGRGPDGPAEDQATLRVKGDARMAGVLHRALWLHVRAPEEGLMYVQGSHRYRVGSARIADEIAALRGNTRYGPGRASLAQRLAHLVLVQMEQRGAAPDDRDQAAVARSRPVKQLLDAAWPKLTAGQVLFRLLADPGFLAEAAAGELTDAEQEALRWGSGAPGPVPLQAHPPPPPERPAGRERRRRTWRASDGRDRPWGKPYRSWRSAKWSAADAVLLDELSGLIDRSPSLSHLIVDEAQDLSPMQCRALGRRSAGGSLTVLGDIAQGTSAWAAGDWSSLLRHLGTPDARLAVLDRGYRVPAEIIDFAARLLPDIAPGLTAPTSVRRTTGALRLTPTSAGGYLETLTQVCREATKDAGSVGLVAADGDLVGLHQRLLAEGFTAGLLGADPAALEAAQLVCVPASLAKGLEFDTVVVAEPARIAAAELRGLHRLYVVLTRAVSILHVVHAQPLPAALQAP